MTVQHWLIFMVASMGLSLTPGPSGLLCLTNGACYGFRPTINTVLGGALGFLLVIAASLAGMGALLAASERAFTIAKLLGAAYLIYLGIGVWRSPATVVARPATGAHAARPGAMFTQGLLVAVSNPKCLIFFAAFLPQFMVPGASFATQLLIFGGTFVLIEIVYELLLAGLAQRIAPWLARHGRTFNRATGGAFACLGAVLATANYTK